MERGEGLSLVWLETFLAVARQRSFTAAASTLHLTQPAVSRQVQRLEQAMGIALFDRSGRTVQLTPAGERFRIYAQTVLDQYQNMRRELGGDQVSVTGEVRIATSTTPNEFLVPELVATFVRKYPRVRPYVHVADSRSVAEEVRAGRWDVGFVGMRVVGLDLSYRSVADDEIVLAVPFAHPFAERGEVALVELVGQPFLEREGVGDRDQGAANSRQARTQPARASDSHGARLAPGDRVGGRARPRSRLGLRPRHCELWPATDGRGPDRRRVDAAGAIAGPRPAASTLSSGRSLRRLDPGRLKPPQCDHFRLTLRRLRRLWGSARDRLQPCAAPAPPEDRQMFPASKAGSASTD